jgi:arylsulfatase
MSENTLVSSGGTTAQVAAKKPNIVVFMADDVGIWNISAYHRGMMGGRTPNIDRIANEGVVFTDYYAQQSCTAGRAAFILGQTPFRTGLLKVGLPAAKQGLQDKDPTIAELLKPLGYATAQIGKNQSRPCRDFRASASKASAVSVLGEGDRVMSQSHFTQLARRAS